MQQPELRADFFSGSLETNSEERTCILLKDTLIYLSERCKSDPFNYENWIQYAQCLKDFKMLDLALAAFRNAASLTNSAELQILMGYLYEEIQFYPEAIISFSQSIFLDPFKYEAYNYKGNLLRKLSKHSEAILVFMQGISNCGPNEHLYNNLGNCFIDLEMVKEAQLCYFEAVRLMPSMVAAHCNLSAALKAEGRIQEAIEICSKALTIDPTFSDAYACMGNIMKDISNLNQSVAFYEHALVLNPRSPEILFNLANIFKDTGEVPKAIFYYSKALEVKEWYPEAFCNMVYARIFICDWENIKPNFEKLTQYTKYQVDNSQIPSVQPFHALVYPLAPEDKLVLSQTYASFSKKQVAKCEPFPKQLCDGRIRIGYVSSDFGDHPLSHLMQSIFGLHNRDEFLVFAFALTSSDGSEYRIKIERDCDFFFDVSKITDPYELAQLIYGKRIDVLVNLNGYTRGSRNEIFALHPGRVQITYMGFPGTLGADYIEYLISDKTTTPPNYTKYYSESIIWMPHSYFVNDYLQSCQFVLDVQSRPVRSAPLPNDKFIFANFNQLYKIDPDTFHIWMNIMKRVPQSVLWLLRFPAAGEANIKRHAVAEGVDPERIIFTNLASKKDHINRCYLADLCLDTPLCNGHTTICDVLWSGLPVITLPLKSMASRVAAGLCCALECPEFIAKSPEDYEEKAVRLASGPVSHNLEWKIPDFIRNRLGSSELKALRFKIEKKKCSAPLFNTALWVKNFEKGVKVAIEIEVSGLKPKHIEIIDSETIIN